MNLTPKTHMQIRLQNIAFGVLFISIVMMLAWLSTQYTVQSDWTASNKNSLSQPSIQLLGKLNTPINISAYVTKNELIRKRIKELVRRYQQHKSDLNLDFINPDTRPDLAREQGITADGELIIYYNGRRESITNLDEQNLTNALQRLASSDQRWVVFLTGHGERSPDGKANFDYGLFAQQLKQKGFNTQRLNLIETPDIPRNTTLLVIASSRTSFIAGEVKIIQNYISAGGQLLWLTEPNQPNIFELAETLGISFSPGIVVDATTRIFGIDDPTNALVTEYPEHPATRHLQGMSLFPGASGINRPNAATNFIATPLLSTLERSWTETGSLEGNIKFDENSKEQQGPITIGYALTRDITAAEGKDISPASHQRIAVIGDGDFLSNAFLGNGSNLDLGLGLFQWLNHDDNFISVPAKTSNDTALEISNLWSMVFGIGFLVLLPLLFFTVGVVIWYKRRRR
ncbi:MAG: ABC transporter [Cycloclasticus sp. symbiont of Poecilosclerida sp. M]|nr:MAG: ABC transporter [Cycloclasticus sp. symbiont of Poecilosclerida sp. M]